ncbi:MAG TPA: hypothetical protein VHQ03_12045 [Candidatus Dormibacteraeota bacterium]|jgi:hypothetical protein|nr:hypothetical protein [Candidatus Dormibacteraeota bacterium]
MYRRLGSFVFALAALLIGSLTVQAAKPPLEPMYANGDIVYMSAPHGVPGPGADQHAQDFYVIAYSKADAGAPITLPSGYQPLCDPCFFPGAPVPAYREVVLEGAPGFGSTGTAGAYNPLWHVFLLVLNPAWENSLSFVPARSAADIDAGEAAGHFIPLNAILGNPGNPFEVDTGIYFLCVIVSPNA